MKIGLVHLSPLVFPLDQKTRLKCAANGCEKPMLFCESVIFNWVDGQKFANAGFCCYACALTSMSTENMPMA